LQDVTCSTRGRESPRISSPSPQAAVTVSNEPTAERGIEGERPSLFLAESCWPDIKVVDDLTSSTMRYATNLFRYSGYYVLSWFLAYVLTLLLRGDTLDFGFFLEYLVLGWTFTGFELPMFMWMFSIIIFLIFCFVVDPAFQKKMANTPKS
jgi:hypothetical protein